MSYGMAKFVDDLTTWLATLATRFYILYANPDFYS